MKVEDVRLALGLKARFEQIGLPAEYHECIIAQLLNGYGLFSDAAANFVLLAPPQTVQDGIDCLNLAYPS